VCCTVERFRCYSSALRLPRVVRMLGLAKRENNVLQGSKVLRDRRGRKARLVQQEVAVRLSTSNRSAAQHPCALWVARKENVSSTQSPSLLVV